MTTPFDDQVEAEPLHPRIAEGQAAIEKQRPGRWNLTQCTPTLDPTTITFESDKRDGEEPLEWLTWHDPDADGSIWSPARAWQYGTADRGRYVRRSGASAEAALPRSRSEVIRVERRWGR